MTTTTCPSKTTTFYQLLEQTPGLDMRDNRGKVHSIALVISGLVMALCCGRDGKLSSLHRNMVNHFTALCKATNSSQAKPISRSQLPILLAKVNGAIFSKLLLDWFNIELNTGQKAWFACDGKDLRAGRPEPKHTSGETAWWSLRISIGSWLSAYHWANILSRPERKWKTCNLPTT